MAGPPKYPDALKPTATAREIIDADKRKHDAKTARLREARLGRDTLDASAAKVVNPKAKR